LTSSSPLPYTTLFGSAGYSGERAGAGAGRDRGGESPLRVYLGVLRLDGRAVDETAVADVARRGLPFRTDGRPDASWRSADGRMQDRKSTRLNSSHVKI